MKLVRDLERRLEQLVEGVAGKVFRGSVHPAELAARIVREADLGRRNGPLGPVAPNQFAVHLSEKDTGALAEAGQVNRELERAVEVTAAARGWRLEGPARVWLEADPTVSAGMVKVHAEETPGPRPAWGKLVTHDQELDLTVNRSLVGRGADADVTIAVDTISRRHALLWQEDDAIWIYDLGSANGTFVDGVPARQPTTVEPGQRVTLGTTPFVLQVV